VVTPRKAEIIHRATAKALEKEILAGLPGITPTERELKETGMFQEAQIDLMQVDQEALSEQRRYLGEMAGEMNLAILPIRGLATLKRETGYEWTNGWTKHEKHKPKVSAKEKERKKLEKYIRDQQERKKREWIKQAKKEALPKKKQIRRVQIPVKPKKRKRLHVGRNGKKPRKLKGFVFGDDVWKVRKPRRRR